MAAKVKHEKFMSIALKEARKAFEISEVPVGAVIVKDGKIVAKGFNRPVSRSDPTAHAEIVAIRIAAKKLKNYRLTGAVLYVTKEPCVMCAGAMVNARIKEIVFGCYDRKAGACGSVFNIADNNSLNHRMDVTGGVMEIECGSLLKNFFKNKR